MKRRKTSGEFPARRLRKVIRNKLAVLLIVVVLALIALVVYITVISARSGEEYSRIVLSNTQQQYQSRTLPFKRGDILDCNGTILASSERVYNLILDCSVVNDKLTDSEGKEKMPYRDATLKALSEVFDIDSDKVEKILDDEKTKDSMYYVLKRDMPASAKEAFEAYCNVSDEEGLTNDEAIKRASVRGIWFEETYTRVYPQGTLGCDVIGFCNNDSEADWGVEGYYNDMLIGTNGRVFGYYNTDMSVEQTTLDPKDGNSIVTTCDVNIMQIVRSAIEDFQKKYKNGPNGKRAAANIAAVVMNPNNGEILAMDSTDWYDLNDPRNMKNVIRNSDAGTISEEEQTEVLMNMWRNFCISDAYEPGSVVKPFTASAALETASINSSETFICDGTKNIDDISIHCSIFPNTHGELNVSGAISQSCNDVMMQIAEKTGKTKFSKYQDIFNFGMKTGVDLPGESTGVIFNEEEIGETELATNAFGQGFTCTMIQEISALCSIVNGGTYYKPHILKAVKDAQGNLIKKSEAVVERRTVSAATSELLKQAMGEGVISGTGTLAKVEGYSMGGKTGTAEKLPREDNKFLVSFIGFAPLENPEVVVYVIVDEPNVKEQDDSAYAQGIAKRIFTELFPYMNIFPDESTKDVTLSGVGSEKAGESTGIPAPPEGELDESVINGGNDMNSDGIENEEGV